MDRYDVAIKYLTENPGKIYEAWNLPVHRHGGSLFLWCGPKDDGCGCLTEVKSALGKAGMDELTEAIRNDRRVPIGPRSVTVADLPVFAEYQRQMDAVWPDRGFGVTADDFTLQEIADGPV